MPLIQSFQYRLTQISRYHAPQSFLEPSLLQRLVVCAWDGVRGLQKNPVEGIHIYQSIVKSSKGLPGTYHWSCWVVSTWVSLLVTWLSELWCRHRWWTMAEYFSGDSLVLEPVEPNVRVLSVHSLESPDYPTFSEVIPREEYYCDDVVLSTTVPEPIRLRGVGGTTV